MVADGIAFLFPGQGSQYVGMGKSLSEKYPQARETFEQADRLLDFELSKLCFEGPQEELTKTINAQPAILTTSVAALRVILSQTEVRPTVVAGHSLGEYSALVAAQAVDFFDALRLVRERGRLMQEACPDGRGKMVAILGLDGDQVSKLCQEVARLGVAELANLNGPGQVVVSGEAAPLEELARRAQQQGAKKAIFLTVSGPFHSSLMEPAAQGMAAALGKVTFSSPTVPVIANVDAELSYSQETAKQLLLAQICKPVRWEQSMRRLSQLGVTKAVEVGPGKTLSALLKRIDRDVDLTNVEDEAGVSRFLD
jgi:[acyl-carrier-protein] S-malonyltransferase